MCRPHEVERTDLSLRKKWLLASIWIIKWPPNCVYQGHLTSKTRCVCVLRLTSWEAHWVALLRAGPSFRATFLVRGTGLTWQGLKIQSTTGIPSLTGFRSCPASNQVRRLTLTWEWTSSSPGGLVNAPDPGLRTPRLPDSVGLEPGSENFSFNKFSGDTNAGNGTLRIPGVSRRIKITEARYFNPLLCCCPRITVYLLGLYLSLKVAMRNNCVISISFMLSAKLVLWMLLFGKISSLGSPIWITAPSETPGRSALGETEWYDILLWPLEGF